MATFLLIRHAAHNDVGQRLSGRLPGLELSAAGRAQADDLTQRLRAEPLAAVRSSPRERTVATAQAIAVPHGLTVTTEDALDEIDFGDWTGRSFASLAGDPVWDDWNGARATGTAPGGERMADAQVRIVHHLAAIAAHEPLGCTAIVTHCDMIRAIVCHLLGLSLDRLLRLAVEPASVTRIAMDGDGSGQLLSLNEGGYR
ncbi:MULTISPECIES: histidine phosphatase family protein [unclassified Sphingomonas]|uniref:histidine phosphatase family protein n=1 Tax=unclassified Sphingomonas TaxID=196159 RepID=UPI002269D62E